MRDPQIPWYKQGLKELCNEIKNKINSGNCHQIKTLKQGISNQTIQKRHGWTNLKKIPRAQCTKATARLVLEPVNRIQKTGTGKTFWKGKGKGTFRSDR